jgi:hypothetical protein
LGGHSSFDYVHQAPSSDQWAIVELAASERRHIGLVVAICDLESTRNAMIHPLVPQWDQQAEATPSVTNVTNLLPFVLAVKAEAHVFMDVCRAKSGGYAVPEIQQELLPQLWFLSSVHVCVEADATHCLFYCCEEEIIVSILQKLLELALDGQLRRFAYLFVVSFTIEESSCLRLLLALLFLFLKAKHRRLVFDVRVLFT